MYYESDAAPAAAVMPFRSGSFILMPTGAVTPAPTQRRLPYRPIWTGLLLNAVLYALALWFLYRVPLRLMARPRRITRELMRLRCGQCLICGYDLRYDFARGCPECGWGRGSVGLQSAPPPATCRQGILRGPNSELKN